MVFKIMSYATKICQYLNKTSHFVFNPLTQVFKKLQFYGIKVEKSSLILYEKEGTTIVSTNNSTTITYTNTITNKQLTN